MSIRKKIGPGLHINYDDFIKTVLILGPFSFGIDISVGNHTLLKEDDNEITQSVLDSIEFRIFIPSSYTLDTEKNYTQYEDIKIKHKLQHQLREFITVEIKGSTVYEGTSNRCFTVRGASNLSYCQIWCLRVVGHAAIWSGFVVSIPSLNETPVMTFAR